MLDILKEVCSHLNLSSFTFDILGIEVPDIFSRLQYKFTPTIPPRNPPPYLASDTRHTKLVLCDL